MRRPPPACPCPSRSQSNRPVRPPAASYSRARVPPVARRRARWGKAAKAPLARYFRPYPYSSTKANCTTEDTEGHRGKAKDGESTKDTKAHEENQRNNL